MVSLKKFLTLILLTFLIVCSGFAQDSRTRAGQTENSAPNRITGISIAHGTPNPRGNLEKLFLITKQEGSASIPGELAPAATMADKRLTVFHINDLHGHITDQHAIRGDSHRVAQMVKRIGEAKAQGDSNTVFLFLSIGDEHTGTPFDELVGWNEKEFAIDPVYHVLSSAGLDASVIGNHEVDRGYAMAALTIRRNAAFPVLSANIADSRYLSQATVPQAAIGIAKGLRIGFIGTTTPEETKTRTADDPNALIVDPLEAVGYLITKMNSMVDIFILMNHLGNEGETRHRVPIGDRAIAALAATMTSKPVIVLGGHTHSILNRNGLEPDTIVNGIPIAQAGSYGQFLGKVDITLKPAIDSYTISRTEATLIPIKARDNRVSADKPNYKDFEHDEDYDAAFERTVVQPLIQRLAEKMKETLAKAAPDKELSTSRVIETRYTGECGIANYMNDLVVSRSASFPGGGAVDFAVFNASGLAGGVEPSSTVTFGDWFTVMPYADNIVVTELTGRQLLKILESNAQRLVRPEELKGDKPIDLNGFISRGFLHFSSGIRYTITLGRNAADAKVENVTLHGKPIGDVLDKTYRVAFSSYIASGFEGWKQTAIGAGLPETIRGWDIASLPKLDTGLVYRNEIIAAIRAQGAIKAPGNRPSLLDGRLTVKP